MRTAGDGNEDRAVRISCHTQRPKLPMVVEKWRLSSNWTFFLCMAKDEVTDGRLPITPHLNVHGLEIRHTPTAGRGVFASHPIARDTVIEISPVLLFEAEEYKTHGQYTLLDSYTFIWEKRAGGSTMALALGLGSLFNHNPRANVSYELDRRAECIRYRTCLLYTSDAADE